MQIDIDKEKTFLLAMSLRYEVADRLFVATGYNIPIHLVQGHGIGNFRPAFVAKQFVDNLLFLNMLLCFGVAGKMKESHDTLPGDRNNFILHLQVVEQNVAAPLLQGIHQDVTVP
jgi:hypothetical protein